MICYRIVTSQSIFILKNNTKTYNVKHHTRLNTKVTLFFNNFAGKTDRTR